ncbi:hypothetical protein E2C01_058531 [Portunus trituberculatus]|uniref:Uncharacterized protein n=1 Tax=Portunus trituberculatus TaxID=210409 RepID=A0A5B7H6D8_PORTR|nr:hypothetical protein [Portunus trituberculatus]
MRHQGISLPSVKIHDSHTNSHSCSQGHNMQMTSTFPKIKRQKQETHDHYFANIIDVLDNFFGSLRCEVL